MSLFKLTAWTSDLEAIPVARILAVPEPVSAGGARPAVVRTEAAVTRSGGVGVEEIKILQYCVLIHLVRVEEEVVVVPGNVLGVHGRGQGLPEPDGRGGDGGEGGRGGGPQRTARNFAWRRGVPDQRRGPGGASLQGLAPVPEKRVALPAMASPAPLIVQTAGSGSIQTARPSAGQKSWQVKAAKAPTADEGRPGGSRDSY
jgi:hypothetical protein